MSDAVPYTAAELAKADDALLKRLIVRELSRYLDDYNRRFTPQPLTLPEVDTSLVGRAIGQYSHPRYPSGGKPLLRFNLAALRHDPGLFFSQTLPHELAHFIVRHRRWPKGSVLKPHGPEWRQVCVALTGHELPIYHRLPRRHLGGRRTRYIEAVISGTTERLWVTSRHRCAIQRGHISCSRTGNLLSLTGREQLAHEPPANFARLVYTPRPKGCRKNLQRSSG